MTTGENAPATLVNRDEHCAGPAGTSRCHFSAETSSRAATTWRRSSSALAAEKGMGSSHGPERSPRFPLWCDQARLVRKERGCDDRVKILSVVQRVQIPPDQGRAQPSR